MRYVRALLKRVLPARFVDWFRRRRVLRLYLRDLSHDLLVRQTRLELGELDEEMATHRDRLRETIAHDVLVRTDTVLQELDRHIEGVAVRTGQRLDEMHARVDEVRDELERLRRLVEQPAGPRAVPPEPVPEDDRVETPDAAG